jgi:hypothetical protein
MFTYAGTDNAGGGVTAATFNGPECLGSAPRGMLPPADPGGHTATGIRAAVAAGIRMHG